MCRVDESEGGSVCLRDVSLRARRAHRCGECRRTVEAGETYRLYAGISDGEFFTAKTCQHCQVLSSWLNRECRGYYFRELIEDIDEHGVEYGRRDLRALARLARMQWLWRGQLVRVPEVPPGIGVEDLAA